MNDISINILIMINIIKLKKIVTIRELANLMNYSESTIKRYIKYAKENGYEIQSVVGRCGGYRMKF